MSTVQVCLWPPFLAFAVIMNASSKQRIVLPILICIMGVGCQSDECIRLCTAISTQLDSCQNEWNTDWRYLDASSATAFQNVCQDSWSDSITTLEWRERVEAESQCDEVLTQLANNEIECVDLQLLYFYDPK